MNDRRKYAAGWCAFWATLLPLAAAESPELREAVAPLEEGVPDVAVHRLRELLGGKMGEEEKRAATAKLAEALIAANRPAEALALFDDVNSGGDSTAQFWRAQALAALTRWPEALPVYQALAMKETDGLRSAAAFGAAESLRALGRSEEALAALAPLLRDSQWGSRARLRTAELLLDQHDAPRAKRMLERTAPAAESERHQKRLLEGRIELENGHAEQAAQIFTDLVRQPAGVAHAAEITALLALADAHLLLKTPETGDDFLDDFITHHPADSALPTIFAKLDQLYRAEKKPSRNELTRWMRDEAQPRRGLAQWYFAKTEERSGRRDNAIATLVALREGGARDPLFAEPLLELARLCFEDGQLDEAQASLVAARAQDPAPDERARVDLRAGEVAYQARRYAEATPLFLQVAETVEPLAPPALFDAALSALRLGDHEQFARAFQELATRFPKSDQLRELRLEEGLAQAARNEPTAAASLQQFAREFPDDPRVAEAWVALAELAFHASPPDLENARKNLARAAGAKPNAAAREEADYLAIWLEEGDAKLIARALQFLREHEDSDRAAEVRMKLAEAYFQRQDFPNAQTQFELLARGDPESPLAEKALFFAAESAAARMDANALARAIVLFGEVVQRGGEMKWLARNEQAAAERKLGRNDDALVLSEEVLKGDARPEVKWEALCAKGDTLYALGSADAENYRRARAAFEQLANTPGVTAHWRNQARFKQAKCLENLGDAEAALATYYEVLDADARADKQREYFWYYKAGFSAARLLETQSKWPSAVAIYRKLSAAEGPRSEEAKARLTRLQLEHFLWDD